MRWCLFGWLAWIVASVANGAPSTFVVFLESGKGDAPLTREQAVERQALHRANLARLHQEGKSPLAGPLDGGTLRGIVVVSGEDEAAVDQEFVDDPFVAHGHLTLRTLRLSNPVGVLSKPSSPPDFGTYTLALLLADDDRSDAEEAKEIARLTDRVRAHAAHGLLAYGGALAGDDDIAGMFLFRTDDQGAVETLLDDVIADDLPFTPKLYVQYLAKGILESAREPLTARVAVIGASVSAGYGTNTPLADILDLIVLDDESRVIDASHRWMSTDPNGVGEFQVDECVAEEATLVIGVDYLFWFAYSLAAQDDESASERNELLEQALALLDRIECPLVIGTVPDVEGVESGILPSIRRPSDETLREINHRIASWAAERPHVLLVPLDEWVKQLKSGEWMLESPNGGEPRRVTVDETFLPDRLHPSITGVVMLLDRTLLAIREHYGERAKELRFDLSSALEKIVAMNASTPVKRGSQR